MSRPMWNILSTASAAAASFLSVMNERERLHDARRGNGNSEHDDGPRLDGAHVSQARGGDSGGRGTARSPADDLRLHPAPWSRATSAKTPPSICAGSAASYRSCGAWRNDWPTTIGGSRTTRITRWLLFRLRRVCGKSRKCWRRNSHSLAARLGRARIGQHSAPVRDGRLSTAGRHTVKSCSSKWPKDCSWKPTSGSSGSSPGTWAGRECSRCRCTSIGSRPGEVFPPFLYVSIINSCNLRCQGCWVDVSAKQQTIEPEALHKLIGEAKEMGNVFFGIVGGEPFMHPQPAGDAGGPSGLLLPDFHQRPVHHGREGEGSPAARQRHAAHQRRGQRRSSATSAAAGPAFSTRPCRASRTA